MALHIDCIPFSNVTTNRTIPRLVILICSSLDGHDFARDTSTCLVVAHVHLGLLHEAVQVMKSFLEGSLRAYRQCGRQLHWICVYSRPSYHSSHGRLGHLWIRMLTWLRFKQIISTSHLSRMSYVSSSGITGVATIAHGCHV